MNIVEQQVQHYNNRDLQSFLDCYHDTIIVKMLQTDQIITEGKEALSQVMGQTFQENGTFHTRILNMVTQGNLVITHDENTNHVPGKIIYSISIFEILDNKISKLWFGGRTEEAE